MATGTMKAENVIEEMTLPTARSGYKVRLGTVYKCGRVVMMDVYFIKNDSSAFEQNRITIADIPSTYRPISDISFIGSGNSSIGSFANRSTSIILSHNGDIIIDNFFSSDIKQICVCCVYLTSG